MLIHVKIRKKNCGHLNFQCITAHGKLLNIVFSKRGDMPGKRDLLDKRATGGARRRPAVQEIGARTR